MGANRLGKGYPVITEHHNQMRYANGAGSRIDQYRLFIKVEGVSARVFNFDLIMLLLLVAAISFLSLSSGVNGNVALRKAGHYAESKIVGGDAVTDIRSRPYHAAIEIAGLDLGICSGAIVSTEWVVTSGSCVALLLPIDIQIRVGSVRNGYGGDVYEVAEVVQHPYFEFVWFTSVDYDAGVVKTAIPITLGLEVRPIALPRSGLELTVGTPVAVTGWGVVSPNDGAQPPRTLQVGSLSVIGRPSCNATQNYIGNITSRMICAGSLAQDTCLGDDGGPLVVDTTIFGVVSWGTGCGIGQFLSVFTNLANPEIRQFITDATGL